MSRRMLILCTALTLIFGAIFGFIAIKNKMIGEFMAAYVPPPVTVQTTTARAESWEQNLSAVGVLAAVNGVEVSAEVDGIVRQILFSAGQAVQIGQPLLQLEDSVEQANLRSLEAQLRLTQITFERDKLLLRSKSISQTDFDRNEAQYSDQLAQVERARAILMQKLIRAPFAGSIGISDVNIGDYLNRGQPIVTLQSLDTLYTDFTVPERFLPKLAVGQQLLCSVDAYPERLFAGVVTAVDVKIDENTHGIRLRATLTNQSEQLLPGMFVGVSIRVGEPVLRTTVPVTAITYSLYGDAVFVVTSAELGAENVLSVERRYITTGDERSKRVAIAEGLAVGEQVVTAGQMKLRNGAAVVIDTAASL